MKIQDRLNSHIVREEKTMDHKKMFIAALIFFAFAASQGIAAQASQAVVAQDDQALEEKTCLQTYQELRKQCYADYAKPLQQMTKKESEKNQSSSPMEDCFTDAMDEYDFCLDDMGEFDEDKREALDEKKEEGMEKCLEKWDKAYEAYAGEWDETTDECCESRFIRDQDLCDMIRYMPPDEMPEGMEIKYNIYKPRFNMCFALKMRKSDAKLAKCQKVYDKCADKIMKKHFKKIKRAIRK